MVAGTMKRIFFFNNVLNSWLAAIWSQSAICRSSSAVSSCVGFVGGLTAEMSVGAPTFGVRSPRSGSIMRGTLALALLLKRTKERVFQGIYGFAPGFGPWTFDRGADGAAPSSGG